MNIYETKFEKTIFGFALYKLLLKPNFFWKEKVNINFPKGFSKHESQHNKREYRF